MKKSNLYMLLAGCGMVTLLFAGCGGGGSGGGGGGGGGGTTTIDTPAQATAAAGTATQIFTGGLSSLVPSGGGGGFSPAPKLDRVHKFVTDFTAKNAPQLAKAYTARAKRLASPARKAAVAAAGTPQTCTDGGTVTYNYTSTANGGYIDETIYDNCSQYGEVTNGKELEKLEVDPVAMTEKWSYITGDGDATLETTDLVTTYDDGLGYVETFTDSGTETDTFRVTSGTWAAYNSSPAGNYSGTENYSAIAKFGVVSTDTTGEGASTNVTAAVNLTGSANGTHTAGAGSSYTDTGTSTDDGSVSATIRITYPGGSQSFTFGASLDNMTDTFSYAWDDLTYIDTEYHSPNGTISLTLPNLSDLGFDCYDGTFSIATNTPIKSVDGVKKEGEVVINGNTKITFTPDDIVTVRLGDTIVFGPLPEEDLILQSQETCPMGF